MLTSLKIITPYRYARGVSEEMGKELKETARSQASSKIVIVEYSVHPTRIICFARIESLSNPVRRQAWEVETTIVQQLASNWGETIDAN